jgi:HlyD family secretion protein
MGDAEEHEAMKKKLTLAISLLALAAVAVILFGVTGTKTAKAGGTAKTYEFATIKTGSVEKTISTSGTLEPVSEVAVLSEMSGQAEKVFASYNEYVKKGQVLVSLNTDMLKVEELQAAAAVQKAQANYDLKLLDYQNKLALAEKNLVSAYDLASSKSSLAAYAADLASSKASYQVIETELNQYALVRSPIDGIVLDRNVDPGQSVVVGSSSNATTLFTLAEDLANMQIEAQVDELDISAVKVGQEVRFTVDSQPGKTYEGKVKEIHLVPKTTNSVVNYYVIINASNKDNTLLPGMTATTNFIVAKKENVFTVPNAALRYTPTSLSSAEVAKKTFLAHLEGRTPEEIKAAEAKYDEAVAEAAKAKAEAASKNTSATGLAGMVLGGGGPGRPGGFGGAAGRRTASTAGGASQAVAQVEKKALWYLDSAGAFQCVLVEPGVSDGINTEVSGSQSLEGMKIILKEKAE